MLNYPTLDVDLELIRNLLTSDRAHRELRNPHPEPPVSKATKDKARASAVLIPIVDTSEPCLIVTRRNPRIRFAGHVCFPGGTVDKTDASPVDTALRETEEEIRLSREQVDVLGELGHYYTQAGYLITPVVGLVSPDYSVEVNPLEVDEIYEIPLHKVLNADSYSLTWRSGNRGHFAFHHEDVRIAGPTVSLMINLYECLLEHSGIAVERREHVRH